MPPKGPEERRDPDDQEVERSQEAGLPAVPIFVPGHPVVYRRPAIDEVSQGNAPVHVGCAHDTDVIRDARKVAVTPFPLQEPAEDKSDEVLRQLPNLQEDGGQGVPHITRTR